MEGVDVGEGAGGVGLAQEGQELAAKEHAHDLDGEEDSAAHAAEATAVESEAAGGDDRVDVRVEVEVARPGVQHERGAERRVEPLSPSSSSVSAAA